MRLRAHADVLPQTWLMRGFLPSLIRIVLGHDLSCHEAAHVWSWFNWIAVIFFERILITWFIYLYHCNEVLLLLSSGVYGSFECKASRILILKRRVLNQWSSQLQMSEFWYWWEQVGFQLFLVWNKAMCSEQAELFSKFGLYCVFRNKWPCAVSYFKSLLKSFF